MQITVNYQIDWTSLLIGSRAITVSHGMLGSPVPDRLTADTLNSYAAPSNTPFTA